MIIVFAPQLKAYSIILLLALWINQIKYKAENVGIKTIITEESYTSGTSFLDNEKPIKSNYNKNRRIASGLMIYYKYIFSFGGLSWAKKFTKPWAAPEQAPLPSESVFSSAGLFPVSF